MKDYSARYRFKEVPDEAYMSTLRRKSIVLKVIGILSKIIYNDLQNRCVDGARR